MYITNVHPAAAHAQATTGFSAPRPAPQPSPYRIERSVGFPAVASHTSAAAPRDKGLSRYRVSPDKLRGLKPDHDGIYTRVGSDHRRSYFARVGEGVYQVGGFNKQDPSWKVLDPRSGKEVARLERKDGQWAVAESSVEPSVEPSHKRSVQQPVATHGGAGSGQGQGAQAGGARAGRGGGGGGGGGASGTSRTGAPPSESHSAADRGHMARLVDGAIDWIEGAIAKLHQPWSRALTEEMNKLFGDEALTEEGKARIEQKLEQTLKFLQQSKSSGEGNLHISGENLNPQHPNAPAFTNTVTGDIYFKPDFMRQTSESYLIQTMVHEATHAGAKTVDDWYLYPNEERYPNWDGHQALFNFDTAINTADSLAHAVQAFHKYA